MQARKRVFIAGAGGIGSAAGILLRSLAKFEFDLFFFDARAEASREAAATATSCQKRRGLVEAIEPANGGGHKPLAKLLDEMDIVLDCLPGSESPRLARAALKANCHYANITEHLAATVEIATLARGAGTGFILQTGLAPGFVNILARKLFLDFCDRYGVDRADHVRMKVGALTRDARPPHYYGFTWSPVGVATEYLEPSEVIRNYERAYRPSLSGRRRVRMKGASYEEALTSGGAADLPTAMAGKVRHLDYKTLRYPGHYDFVDRLLAKAPVNGTRAEYLQEAMQSQIPMVEEDVVIAYAGVAGPDRRGVRKSLDRLFRIEPKTVGGVKLRAIQVTTAAALAEAANLLLSGRLAGPVFQSDIEPGAFLEGPFISRIYGKGEVTEALVRKH